MRNSEWSKMMSIAGRIVLAFLFVLSQNAWAGQEQKGKGSPKPGQKAAVQQAVEKPSPSATTAKTETEEGQAESSEKSSAEEKPSGDRKHEGIKVHGHWTIEIHNPDGSLITHREFENSYVQSQNLLPLLLSRTKSPGSWAISIGIMATGQSATTFLNIAEPFFNGPGTLTPPTVSATGQLLLAGNGSAPISGNIILVQSLNYPCLANVSPAVCDSPAGAPIFTPVLFTSAQLATPIPVSTGQIIQVNVVISFS